MLLTNKIENQIQKINQRRPAYRTKVFGIGYPKTGTTTLGYALRKLGYKHQSYNMELAAQVRQGDYKGAIALTRSYESFDDWPWFLMYQALDQTYPNAKFVLTRRRDSQHYVDSLHRHRVRQGVYEKGFEAPSWWEDVFGYAPTFWDADKFKSEYDAHNKSVTEHFKDRPDKLLVVSWEEGSGWRELCQFLGRRTPQEPFPHLNKT